MSVRRPGAPAPPALPVAALRRALPAWYRRHARALPWRESRDPYRTWVSEVMLQQTQVATATPYFARFVARFPDVRALAAAPLDEVLAHWSGLGYYRRARALHAAAGEVVREHGGEIPANAEAFGALPGVGRYTLGAVLSMGFGAPLPVLDGNVARVLARLAARPWQVRRPADARVLWDLAAALVPPRGGRAGEWNEALMELGATVCTPRAPRCAACPVARHCRGHASGDPERFPPPAPRRTTLRVRRAVAWIEAGGRVLLAKRRGALLAGLWEPPGVELVAGAAAAPALARWLREHGVRATLVDSGLRVRHAITHRAIEVELWRGRLRGRPPAVSAPDLRWEALGDRPAAVTALTRKLAARVRRG